MLLLGGFISLVMLISLVPVLVNQKAIADRSILECSGATPTLNESFTPPICCNATGQCDTNSTPSAEGLSPTEDTLLSLVPLFLVIAVGLFGFMTLLKK